MTTNILKIDDMFTMSDFEKVMLAKQYDKLYRNSIEENKNLIEKEEDKRIYNLSMKDIVYNLSTTITQIINDIIILSKSSYSFNDYINIFVKDNRIIYIGILFIILSFIFLFIFLSS
jgi:hypothetical protein